MNVSRCFLGGWLRWALGTLYYMGSTSPNGKGSFGGCPVPWKALWVTAAVYASKKINNGISATAATDCIAPDLPMSLELFPVKNLPPPRSSYSTVFCRLWRHDLCCLCALCVMDCTASVHQRQLIVHLNWTTKTLVDHSSSLMFWACLFIAGKHLWEFCLTGAPVSLHFG